MTFDNMSFRLHPSEIALPKAKMASAKFVDLYLDNYDNKHFLIKAIEGRLDRLVAREQLIHNNLDSYNIVLDYCNIETEPRTTYFCINFSCKMQHMERVFGEDNISKFAKEQLSTGKENYSEDFF